MDLDGRSCISYVNGEHHAECCRNYYAEVLKSLFLSWRPYGVIRGILKEKYGLTRR